MTNLESTLAALCSAARIVGENSDEQIAIDCAAKAILFIQQSNQLTNFQKYLEEFHADLTDEQKEHLKSRGLDPSPDDSK